MEDLIKMQLLQIQALQNRNTYLENELKQAKPVSYTHLTLPTNREV